jgi:hypothetical protein
VRGGEFFREADGTAQLPAQLAAQVGSLGTQAGAEHLHEGKTRLLNKPTQPDQVARQPLLDTLRCQVQARHDVDGSVQGEFPGTDALKGIHDPGQHAPVPESGMAVAPPGRVQPGDEFQLLLPVEQRDRAHLFQVNAQAVAGLALVCRRTGFRLDCQTFSHGAKGPGEDLVVLR